MFTREIQATLEERLSQFPIVALIGPRQSGKTTLLRQLANYQYLNLESPETLERLQTDPNAILHPKAPLGLILDEAQKAPALFSYLQVIVDANPQKGRFILSGSQNFLLNQQISQSLAGRIGILELLPLSFEEYQSHPNLEELDLWSWLYKGGYPRPYQEDIPIRVWMDNYVRTYVERDVRQLLKVKDLNLFQRFLKLCAGRHGQLLNINQLSTDCGISHATTNHWLTLLEASYLIYRLPPYYENFNKRLIKSSKLYFYDSGLVCYLLGIDSPEHLNLHSSRGAIFEGYVITEIKKIFANKGMNKALYFWRDNHGNEIDCMLEHQGKLHVLEIKSTSTFQKGLASNLIKFETLCATDRLVSTLIYAGEAIPAHTHPACINWQTLTTIFS